jgi:hypothetical protein
MAVADPLIIMYQDRDSGKIMTIAHPRPDMTYEHYGLLICDFVRHIAKFFDVSEDAVWTCVERERNQPTDKSRIATEEEAEKVRRYLYSKKFRCGHSSRRCGEDRYNDSLLSLCACGGRRAVAAGWLDGRTAGTKMASCGGCVRESDRRLVVRVRTQELWR